ncbi:ParB/RepB/Spo0J family partition protein [Candidatus Falkowbacteria bacterium]|nr:ParB/RepB/Spo0J family partition protein [Candidatus Falkowbacteria bacterium]
MATALGRGLGSLIPQKVNKVTTDSGEAIVATVSESEQDRILHLDPNKVKVNHLQPRKSFSEQQQQELVDSIKRYGIIQPLIVTKKEGEYELIAGERRLRSARILKLDTVPVIVRETKEHEMLEIALIENIQRENLNPIETAISYQKLMNEFNLGQDDLSKRLSKSRPGIANCLRLLSLPEEIQKGLIDGSITESHAKVILGLDTVTKQLALFRTIVHSGMSVNDATKESRKMGGTKQARVQSNVQDQDKEQKLREVLGTKVEIRRKAKGGQVVIDFYSDEELVGLMGKLGK